MITYLAATEAYNGATWTEVNDLNTARNNMGTSGTYTLMLLEVDQMTMLIQNLGMEQVGQKLRI